MLGRILKKDISRNKVVTATLFLFILLAAMLVSGAVNIIITLFGSIDSLLEKSNASHFVQMHAGEIDQLAIDSFAAANKEIVKEQQIAEMLNINGTNIFLGGENSEADSVMENAFVKQNHSFDFLLDTDNQVLRLSNGEIAVPLYHMQQYDLRIGDTVKIAGNGFDMEFTIVAFVRDAQMNPSVVTSKRFLVSDGDWEALKNHIGEIEYLIEFRLHDISRIGEFERLYQNTALPQKGPAITYSLLKLMNGITDGVVAAVIVLISLLLIAIAALCLRFTLTATIEEDYREIGVMKAIGINSRDIRRLYMMKYVAVAAMAGLLGYAASFFVGGLFTANISLYMGTAPKTIWNGILPALGTFFVFLSVVLFCRLTLRRFRKISAVEAMRDGSRGSDGRAAKGFRLSRSRFGNVNMFLGAKAVFSRFSMYGVLCFIFTVCVFLMAVPINFLNTLKSPDFVSYMGAGRCDIRIDVFSRQEDDIEAQYAAISDYLENDKDISKYVSLVTAVYKVKNADGAYETINIETGDFSVFPLTYLHGTAPGLENEIALSSMNAEELGKSVGDTLTLSVGDEERALTVCGIYQDVTNGGKTAKGLLPYTSDNVLRYVVNIEVAGGVSAPAKIAELGYIFPNVKITDMDDYVSQTLGGLIEQLSLAATFAFVLALAIAVLITAMFFKMLIAKEASGIAVMRSLGLSCRNIRLQYITRGVLALFVGIAMGGVAAVPLGQRLAGMLVSGISSMRFIINPLMSFIVCPLALGLAVGITVFFGSASIKKTSVMLVAE